MIRLVEVEVRARAIFVSEKKRALAGKGYKVSDNRAYIYMGIIAGYMGIYCHICIRISPPSHLGAGG